MSPGTYVAIDKNSTVDLQEGRAILNEEHYSLLSQLASTSETKFICQNVTTPCTSEDITFLNQFAKQSLEYNPKDLARATHNKRKTAKRIEKRKSVVRNSTSSQTMPENIKRKGEEFKQQATFVNMLPTKEMVTSLVSGVKNNVKSNNYSSKIYKNLMEFYNNENFVPLLLHKMSTLVSSLHLLKGETRPSKIIATLVLTFNSLVPEVSQNLGVASYNYSYEICGYLEKRLGFNLFKLNGDEIDSHEHRDHFKWILEIPKYVQNWEAIRQSPAFTKISELISILATMGFVESSKLTVNVRGLELMRLGTMRKHANAGDLISAVLHTLEYFLSGGYEFFKTGSPRKFLFDEYEAREFDDLYEMLVEATPHAKTLNLPIMKVKFKGEVTLLDDVKYLEHLNNAIDMCRKCKKISKNSWQISYFQSRLEKMLAWRADFHAKRCNGKFRKAPLSLWLYGTSGVGKSTLSQIFIKTLLRYMGVPEDELDRIASINEQDKYDSTIIGGIHAFLTDDVMNTKSKHMEGSPTQKIIDHNNNAPIFANKAELEGKGVTPIVPKLTLYTSNCKIQDVAQEYSNCTESIIRRMKIILDIRVKPEFCIPGETRMDESKVIEVFGDDPMPDVWDIVISCASTQSNTGVVELDDQFRPTLGSGHCFGIMDIMGYCYHMADIHMRNQNTLERIQENLVPKLAFCQNCKKIGKMCTCALPQCVELPFNCVKTRSLVYADDDALSAAIRADIEKVCGSPNWETLDDDDIDDYPDYETDTRAEDIESLFGADRGIIIEDNPKSIKSDVSNPSEVTFSGYDTDDILKMFEGNICPKQFVQNGSATPQAPYPLPPVKGRNGRLHTPMVVPFDYGFKDHSIDESENNITFCSPKIPLKSFVMPFKKRPAVVMREYQATFNDLTRWLEYMPQRVLDLGDMLIVRFFAHWYVRYIYWALWSHSFSHHIRNTLLFAFLIDVIGVSCIVSTMPRCLVVPLISMLQVFLTCCCIAIIVKWYRERMSLLDKIGTSVRCFYAQVRNYNWRRICLSAGVVVAYYYILKQVFKLIQMRKLNREWEYWLKMEDRFMQESTLQPENSAEVKERDLKESDWAKPEIERLNLPHSGRTSTHDQLLHKIEKNLYHVVFVSESGGTNKCDGLVVEGNNMLLPMHVFGSNTKLKVSCRKKAGDGLNTIFKGYISKNTAGSIPGVDLIYVHAPFLNPHTSLLPHFPSSLTHLSGSGQFMWRNESGGLSSDYIGYRKSRKHSGGQGFTYALPYPTFNGLCMGVLTGDFDVPCIAGVHLLGIPDHTIGMALTITQDMLSKLIKSMDEKCVLRAVSNGTFPEELYGKKILDEDSEIHVNSPLRYLPKYSRIIPLGNCPGRSSHTKSSVHKTIISDLVEDVCGVPNKWGPPAFNARRQWQASMQYSANTSIGFDPEVLEWAMLDYKKPIVEVLKSPKHKEWVQAEFRPLNDMEIMTGRDGVRFIDAMPKNTSKGFPLSGPKEEWIVRLNPDLYEDFACPVDIHESIKLRAEEMKQCFLRGERAYAIFKACAKDEPTKIGKEKVRIFQASDWAFQLLVRKYFLPLARLLSVFPLVSECAVGINAHGPEWDELARHISKYGEDRILAGDYGKFDLRMPAQMILASYKVAIDICKECGDYSCEDLQIMRGIATEIAYSVVAYNGDMIIHNGSHPSGNNMTVYINCIDNCLNFRCAFATLGLKQGYTLKNLPTFKSICALMTYGDDAKSSVKKGYDWFNHITLANFLAENDIVFTMPDKESEPTPYMTDADADFLKRKNVYNPETGLIHGALDEDSIFKSLHSVLKSSIGPKQHAAGNIEGALREWFHHGRDVFEKRHKQMIEIAERANLQNILSEIDEEKGTVMKTLYQTYDDRLEVFKQKHNLE